MRSTPRVHLLAPLGVALAAGLALAACSPADDTPADAGVTADAAATADAAPAGDAAPALDAEVHLDAALDASAPDAAPADAAPADAEPSPDAAEPPLGPVTVDLTLARPPALLSDFAFFRWRGGQLEYNEGVVPYDLGMPLFSDYALKGRALWLPPGTAMTFDARGVFDLPVGSAVLKTFLFPADLRAPERGVRIVETRLLVRFPDGWRAYPYLWRADGSDADYRPGGALLPLSFVDAQGTTTNVQYLVPQRVQCLQCHEQRGPDGSAYTTPIGPKARHLNRERDYGAGPVNQLQHLADLGLLTGLPSLASVERDFDLATVAATGTTALSAAEVEKAARDYLDVNCAHCHNRSATQGVTSQLFLDVYETDAFHYGVCKSAGSAGTGTGGFDYDVVPGDPDRSILYYRIATTTVGDMMPLLGRSLRHDLGVSLVRAWIQGLPARTCP